MEKAEIEKLDTERIQDVSSSDTQDSIDKISNNSIRFINKTHTCSNCSLEEVQNGSNEVQNEVQKSSNEEVQVQNEPNELVESDELNQDQVQIETEENNNQVQDQVQDQNQEETSSMKDELMQNLEPYLDHESSKDKRRELKEVRDLFDIFWSQYPRKQGKQKCLNWFETHKPNQELVETMVKALYVQKQSNQWRKNNGMYIPMPITWLHQARWEDEMEVKIESLETTSESNPNENNLGSEVQDYHVDLKNDESHGTEKNDDEQISSEELRKIIEEWE